MTTVARASKRRNIPELVDMKAREERIVMVSAYDAPTARLAAEATVDAVLVGDSFYAADVRTGASREARHTYSALGVLLSTTQCNRASSARAFRAPSVPAIRLDGQQPRPLSRRSC